MNLARVLSAGLLVVFTATVNAEPVEVIPPQNKVLSTENGRYVFGQISSFRSDQYMLDTATGRLWQVVVDKEKITSLQPVPIQQLFGEKAYVPESVEADVAWRDQLRSNTAESIKQAQKAEQN